MKRIKLFFATAIVMIAMSNAFSQIQMDSAGKVKVGAGYTSGTRNFEVTGSATFFCYPASSIYFEDYNNFATMYPAWGNSMYIGKSANEVYRIYTHEIRVNGLFLSSDSTIKENIKPLTGSLQKLKELKPVKYDIKKEYYKNPQDGKDDKRIEDGKDNTGFIAQELMKIFPRYVNFDEEAGLYEINYISLIPELVKALQEQQESIETLQKEIAQIKTTDNTKKRETITTEFNSATETASLSQNRPNPFSVSTTIEYSVPNATTQAMICIYDMNGTQLRCYTLQQTGAGSITIQGNELTAGMNLYALIADGELIDTKQMILTN